MRKHIDTFNNEIFAPAVAVIQDLPWGNPMLLIKTVYTHFLSDSLYRNSIYLMLSTAIMAFFGFFFWMINARLYTPEQVGIATTLISVIGLIAGFSNLGLNVGLIRFLPTSRNKNELINSSLLISSATSLVLSVIFLLGLHIFSPKLLFLRENPIYVISFIVFAIALSNNSIVESIFVAYRSAKYILVKNSIMSITKLFLPIAFIALSAYGIFTAVGLANIIALALAFFILIKLFNFKIVYKHNLSEVKKISAYSFGNYIAGFLGGLPTMVLPIIITNKIGVAEAGYFYIAMMIASFIYIIPIATTQSLFAEGTYRVENMNEQIIKTAKFTALILFPITIIIILFGNLILSAFGKIYSTEAFIFLQLLAVSSIFVAINSICESILRLNNRVKDLININIFKTLLILLLCFLLIRIKLLGIGIAWVTGLAVVSIIYILDLIKKR